MPVAILCDLRHRFGTARDQDQRPTCLAFAVSDVHAAVRGSWAPLSTEFAFYHAQRRTGRSPHVGATLPAMLEVLREDGQPAEIGWPYLATIPANETDWKPPANVGQVYRRQSENSRDTVDEIIRHLDARQPVLVLLMLSMAFDLADGSGIIDQVPGELPEVSRRHAVVATGHGMIGNDRAILIRNSWGEAWGANGYAWLTEVFLHPRVFGLAILPEDADVSGGSAAA